jgi:nitrite reductase/ring-hydroxylating ferredoxin subunit
MAQFFKTISSLQIAPGSGQSVVVNGKEIAIFNKDGTFLALDNICPHQGGPLSEGSIENGIVACPWHGWRFDLANGKCSMVPGAKVAMYNTKVEEGVVFVEL